MRCSAPGVSTSPARLIGGGEVGGLDTLFAIEGAGQDGPFASPENYNRYKLFARGGYEEGPWRSDLTFTSYRGTWNASGQIPLREIRDGELDRFGSIDPTEGGSSQRHQLYARTDWRPNDGEDASLFAYGVYYDLDLFSNFTFFARDPVNGDQIEQKDKRFFGGGEATSVRRVTFGGFDTAFSGAIGLRGDHIGEQLNYAREPVSSTVKPHNVGQVNSFAYVAPPTPPGRRGCAPSSASASTSLLRRRQQPRVDDRCGSERAGDGDADNLSPKASIILAPP